MNIVCHYFLHRMLERVLSWVNRRFFFILSSGTLLLLIRIFILYEKKREITAAKIILFFHTEKMKWFLQQLSLFSSHIFLLLFPLNIFILYSLEKNILSWFREKRLYSSQKTCLKNYKHLNTKIIGKKKKLF
jgi:hypothetical protein